MKTKRVRPLLVESKESTLHLSHGKLLITSIESTGKSDLYKSIPQELILISLEDEKIEDGELYCGTYSDPEGIAHYCIGKYDKLTTCMSSDGGKVIVRQSQIPSEYISKFIEQYNRGSVEDLEIVMEKCWINSDNVKGNSFTEVAKFEPSINDFDDVLIIQLKLTNGFVTIVEKEPITYTEEEVKSLCSGAYSLGLFSLKSEIPDLEEMMELDNWFENNKKK